jgi:hypothetical protein
MRWSYSDNSNIIISTIGHAGAVNTACTSIFWHMRGDMKVTACKKTVIKFSPVATKAEGVVLPPSGAGWGVVVTVAFAETTVLRCI